MNALHSTGCNVFVNKPTLIEKRAATCIDHVYSNLHTECLENHIILSAVSDHYGTLSKIEGVTRENERRDIYYRKTKLSDQKWEELKTHCKNSLKENIPLPHQLSENALAEIISNTVDASCDKFMPEKKAPKYSQR